MVVLKGIFFSYVHKLRACGTPRRCIFFTSMRMSLLHVHVLDAVALRSFLAGEVPRSSLTLFYFCGASEQQSSRIFFLIAFLCAACCLAFFFAHACRGVRWRYVRRRYPAVHVLADPPAADSAGIVPVLGFAVLRRRVCLLFHAK